MLIQVVYKDGRVDQVEPKFLDILLHMGEVLEFRRSDHWVNVTTDPIRSPRQESFCGMNRRLQRSADLDTAIKMLG